jgi:hypothetical protein
MVHPDSDYTTSMAHTRGIQPENLCLALRGAHRHRALIAGDSHTTQALKQGVVSSLNLRPELGQDHPVVYRTRSELRLVPRFGWVLAPTPTRS